MIAPIYLIALVGVMVFTLLLFQVSLGMRWIKFKGPRHWKIHKFVAWTIIALASGHALAALMYIGVIPGPF